jgi:ADP-glucose pyrophosphorylase
MVDESAEGLNYASQLLPYTDMLGLSAYPYVNISSSATGNTDPALFPANYFERFINLDSSKPLAFAETGYIAENLSIPFYSLNKQGKESWQKDYLEKIFSLCNKHKAELLIWFCHKDYDAGNIRLRQLGKYQDLFGFWEDIGTIEAFYNANLALTYQPDPAFSFYDEKAPIYTRSRYLPPTKLLESHVIESMVGEGCILKECTVRRSVIGIRSRIETGCVIDNALLMGSDYYESPAERLKSLESGKVPLGVGANTTILRAIVDKNARIGRNVRIVNKDRVEEGSREDLGFVLRSGIVVVIKNATIPDGTVI